jgi:hypothetical protein
MVNGPTAFKVLQKQKQKQNDTPARVQHEKGACVRTRFPKSPEKVQAAKNEGSTNIVYLVNHVSKLFLPYLHPYTCIPYVTFVTLRLLTSGSQPLPFQRTGGPR